MFAYAYVAPCARNCSTARPMHEAMGSTDRLIDRMNRQAPSHFPLPSLQNHSFDKIKLRKYTHILPARPDAMSKPLSEVHTVHPAVRRESIIRSCQRITR